MNTTALEPIIQAVLYEGYVLYPYRASSKKNQRERFTFGRVYPREFSEAQHGSEPCFCQTECLLRPRSENVTLEVSVRFLQPLWREVGWLTEASGQFSVDGSSVIQIVPELALDGRTFQTSQEAIEREVNLKPRRVEWTSGMETTQPFSFSGFRNLEPLRDAQGRAKAGLVRRGEDITGLVELSTQPVKGGWIKISIRVQNLTALPSSAVTDSRAVLMHTLTSTHTILQAREAEFMSAIDPPQECKESIAACKNIGTWPVLVGDESSGLADTMLSSPIILYDYPKVAPESAGNFFDGTEIDEMLALRVRTMTDAEKREVHGGDDFARRLLERTEAISENELARPHGTMRHLHSAEEFFNPTHRSDRFTLNGAEFTIGNRVRLRPKRRADAFDLMLAGKIAVIEAIEQDAEERIHVAVVLEDDPGKDLGLSRQPGHRFFFAAEDLEPLTEALV